MMRVSFGKFAKGGAARMALATALATGLVAGGATLGATAAVAKEKEAAKAGAFSKEFVAVAGPLQKALGDAAAAKAKGASTPISRRSLPALRRSWQPPKPRSRTPPTG
jgi:hypothetical protein